MKTFQSLENQSAFCQICSNPDDDDIVLIKALFIKESSS